MVYQMGATNIRKFRKLLGAVAIGDAGEAYRQAMASDWSRQTPERAEKVAARLKEAIIPIPIPKPGQVDPNKVFVSESVPLKPAPPKPKLTDTDKPFVGPDVYPPHTTAPVDAQDLREYQEFMNRFVIPEKN